MRLLWRGIQKIVVQPVCGLISAHKYRQSLRYTQKVLADFKKAADNCFDADVERFDWWTKKERRCEYEKSKYFLEGGRLFHNLNREKITLHTTQLPETSSFELFYGHEFERALDGNYYLNLYGADDFVFKEMEIIEGNIDLEKLKSGKYIVYGLERKPTVEE